MPGQVKWCAPGLAKETNLVDEGAAAISFHEHPQSWTIHPYVDVKEKSYRPPWDIDISTFDLHRTLMESPPDAHEVSLMYAHTRKDKI